RLFDDAGLFPPARLSMAEALTAHHRATSGPHGRYVGPFLCPVTRLDELDACVASGRPRPSELGVIAYGPATPGRRLGAIAGLVQCEAPLGTPLPDLGGRVRRYLAIPPQAPAGEALHPTRPAGGRAKVRRRGHRPSAVPSFARAAAGEQHGFVNLLVAASLACDGGDRRTVAEVLGAEEPDAVDLVDHVGRARELVMSIGTCSIDEPMQALTERGLL